MYYIYIENDKINGCGQCQCSHAINVEVSEEIYNDFIENPDKYINQDGEIAIKSNYEVEKLEKVKELKKQEASSKAKLYLESGNALYEVTPTSHIEATDGNIGKLSAYALGFITGVYKSSDVVYWNTKEDETITLNQDQLGDVIIGLGQVQAHIWNIKFPDYLSQIEAAKTVEEVENIKISYEI